jgi:hypothetical protein
MQENLTMLSIPRNISFYHYGTIILSILLSLGIVVATVGLKDRIVAGVSMATLAVLFYIIFMSSQITSTGLDMYTTVYPPPPRLGLDGISMENRSVGLPL